jgi:hypothetical protein
MTSNHGKAIGALILLLSLALTGTVLGNPHIGDEYWMFYIDYGIFSWSVEATSYLADDAADCSPASAIDGDLSTAWVEGVDGPGIGESLTLTFDTTTPFYGIYLLPGYFATPELWEANNRIKKVQLTLSDGTSFTEEFEDIKQPMYIDTDRILGGFPQIEWFRLTILEVYPGTRWDDTAISEITLDQEI